MNRQILLDSRPATEATAANFRLVTAPLAPLQDGQVRVRNHFLSLDPYMRGRMSDARSYAPPQALGEVMQGGTVGIVEESRNPKWAPGTAVVGAFGWQEWGTSDGTGLRRVNPGRVPLSACLGVVGMPGVTAWYGLNHICRPQSGQTVAVSAASGPVGGTVGQLARRAGCRVVGVAGGPAKCAFVRDELGFDACIDHRGGDLRAALAEAAPDGIDAYFDNVGGEVLNAVLDTMNAHGRVAVCGAIAGYDGAELTITAPRLILTQRLLIQGFIVSEHLDLWPAALKELEELVATGALKYRESVAHGLESAPDAFLGMLKGRNFGKQVVKLV